MFFLIVLCQSRYSSNNVSTPKSILTATDAKFYAEFAKENSHFTFHNSRFGSVSGAKLHNSQKKLYLCGYK